MKLLLMNEQSNVSQQKQGEDNNETDQVNAKASKATEERPLNEIKEIYQKNNRVGFGQVRYCSCVEAYLFKRSCGICGLYFASYKANLNQLNKQINTSNSQKEVLPIAKIHPQKIAPRRAREIFCLSDDDDAVWWLDAIHVDPTNVPDINNPNKNEMFNNKKK
ncbi:unnamed protein product [Pieris macdunnoughi]|uniref:Uncharacterized protein n=1 Tax=Pieris macdunnoughi TaxID=345717 RepID=A0A821XIT8_9NEOP|nr:unnamed protein product [Pieris macdunnoughi]